MSINESSYSDFAEQFHAECYRKRIPYRVLFELTYRCNFKCVHCYHNYFQDKRNSRNELSASGICSIIDKLVGNGCYLIGFTGGEIFLRKDIWEILTHAKNSGLQVVILTNGFFIDKKTADRLKILSPHKVDISFYSLDRRIFESITGKRGAFAKVQRALRLLKERNIPCMLKACTLAYNRNELVEIARYAERLGISYRIGGDIFVSGHQSSQKGGMAVPIENLLQIESECYPAAKSYPHPGQESSSRHRDVFQCGIGFTSFCINPYGDLLPCTLIPLSMGNLLRCSVKKGWDKLKRFVDDVNVKGSACLQCSLYEYCDWCPAKSYLENQTFSSCVPREKEKALGQKKLSFDR
jgi:radical SAM protein with 4Fe4S-binding SPASM domain